MWKKEQNYFVVITTVIYNEIGYNQQLTGPQTVKKVNTKFGYSFQAYLCISFKETKFKDKSHMLMPRKMDGIVQKWQP